MDATEIMLERLAAYNSRLRDALSDLSDEDLLFRPGANDNPAGWLSWHMARVEDRTVAQITGALQAWVEGTWHARFGLPNDPENTGIGHTLEEATSFRATKKDLLSYASAARENTQACLSSLTDEALDEEIEDFFANAKIPVGLMIGRFFGDYISHVGQICYLRGHIKGWGKYGR